MREILQGCRRGERDRTEGYGAPQAACSRPAVNHPCQRWAGGSISPAGSVSVRKGRDQSFVITPDAGYAIGDVKINGESIGAASSYTFEKVKKAHTIEAFFVKQNAFTDIPNGSFYEDAVR